MIKPSVVYEEKIRIDIKKAFNLTMQWLNSQHKAKIKKTTPPSFIEAKQGTMMTNTGHDPNWRKKILISFYTIEDNQTLIRVNAIPIARNIFRVEKLKKSWYNGLFIHLFSVLQTVQENKEKEDALKSESNIGTKTKYCSNCGNKIDKDAIICPRCGIDIV